MLISPYISGGTGGTPTPGGGTGGGTGFNPAQLHHFMQQQQTFLNHHQVSLSNYPKSSQICPKNHWSIMYGKCSKSRNLFRIFLKYLNFCAKMPENVIK